MKKVIISGVTGFFGSALTRKLLALGVQVIGVDIDTPKFEEFKSNENFTAVVAGFDKYEELPSLISDTDIDVFYHFAWAGGFTTAIRDYKLQMSNAGYAGDALVAAHKIRAKKFVYANTYNQYEIINFLESDVFEPRYTCIYSTGKTAASLICRTLAYNLGIEYSAALVPMPYGENNYSKQLVNVVLKNLIDGVAPKLVEGNNLYDLVYIDDIINAFIAIGEHGKHMKEYYVGHRKLKTFREWIIDIRDCIAPNVDLKFGEYKDNQKIDYSKVYLDRLYNDTGFECKADFKKTMLSTVEWVRKNIK
ncbi:Nucleoside-diphosphate-sugar epimerase [Ruminococcaceae bacterium FB2012]|nr:Nucleoside-diphosphate-sugar epimerase [Ruminococcaceae bacterium FB2012]